MENALENPIWHAMISGNSNFAKGNNGVRYFPSEISPFAGLQAFTAENFKLLAQILPDSNPRATFTTVEVNPPAPWHVTGRMQILQMVHDKRTVDDATDPEIFRLDEQYIPEMMALTTLTNPGPFNHGTIDFGNYHGIFKDGKLVSMAGLRLRPYDFTEISAVCTHPDYGGHGYARRLLMHMIRLILTFSQTPILHVKTENRIAIKLYESVGFATNRDLHVLLFKK
jgi:predicted GNAT family acetyltransferase